ncbi:MAG: cyanophycinase [Saprospiraceae bacterium]
MRSLLLLLFTWAATASLAAQGYTSFFTGDTTDVVTDHQFGIVLGGGGQDNDDAMQWMLARAQGGDVVILRESGSDGYNDYFFSELGVSVNSVETILFNDAVGAQDAYVIRRIREAEVLFIAGGDQTVYFDYWRDSPVQEALDYLVNEKAVTIGGTSAGMAILGGAVYAPEDLGVTSDEALADPFDPYMDSIQVGGLVSLPFLDSTLTDTHFENRNRQGRTFTLLARLSDAYSGPAYAIACNNATAVTIDPTGRATVYGEFPEFGDYAFFMQINCASTPPGPENLTPGQPLTWDRAGAAVKVYRVPGLTTPANYFELSDWTTGNGGSWQNWSVTNGVLNIDPNGAEPECTPVATRRDPLPWPGLVLAPQPAGTELRLLNTAPDVRFERLEIRNLEGRLLRRLDSGSRSWSVAGLPAGTYELLLQDAEGRSGALVFVVGR